MDFALSLMNAAASGLITVALFVGVLNPRIRDGIIVKAGLISMAIGFGSIAVRLLDGLGSNEGVGLARAVLLINAGIAVVIVGYVVRVSREGQSQRRVTDWTDLDTRPLEPRPLDWPEVRS